MKNLNKDKVKIRLDKNFGKWFDIDMPNDCDVIIVCKIAEHGLIPFRILLPAQLYQKDITQLLKKETDIKQITIIPARSKDYVDLLKERRE